MKKQKICIIGGSLTGLVTAISLSRLNCEIDLIVGNSEKNIKSNRTFDRFKNFSPTSPDSAGRKQEKRHIGTQFRSHRNQVFSF